MSSFDMFPLRRAEADLDSEWIMGAHNQRQQSAQKTQEAPQVCANHVAILNYFDGITKGERLPRRADLNPAALTPQLPGLVLLDIYPEDLDKNGMPRAQVRVMGERFKEFYGDLTGKGPEDLEVEQTRERYYRTMAMVLETRAPVIGSARNATPGDLPISVRTLFVPLFDDKDNINQLIIHAEIEVG